MLQSGIVIADLNHRLKTVRTFVVAVFMLAICTLVASARTWTDSTGKYTVEAEFVDLKNGKVRLKKEDGKIVAIPIEKLSKDDQEFVTSFMDAKAGKPEDIPDPVEEYIKMAAATRDGYHTVNALMFNPKDPRLQYEHKERSLPAPSSKEVFAKLDPVDSFKYLSTGPKLTKQTDRIEARMLMDKTLVGTGYWKDVQGSEGGTCLVFLDPCSATMSKVREKYGTPNKTIAMADKNRLHYYGRMMLVEVRGGKIHAVLRRMVISMER